jgi:TolB-like protein/DNA-binding winged helix-turn-helix (wHTH) protein/Flp pilus assembly protein TadD
MASHSPSESRSPTESFRLGQWRVEPTAGALYRRGVKVHLQPKVMEVLLFLVRNRERVVLREEILDALWPDTYVADIALARSISQLRRALEDNRGAPIYIETVPKKGYRIIAPVSFPNRWVIHREFSRKTIQSAAVALSLATAVLLLFALSPKPHKPRFASVAVLPFLNLNPNSEDEYLSAGVSEEIIAALSNLNGLRVISRTSSSHYRNSGKSIPEIARELGVETVLEGSARQTGGRIRITAQLIDAESDQRIWGAVFDQEASAMFEIPWEVASQAAHALGLEVDPVPVGAMRRPTEYLEAYKLSLLARYIRYREGEAGNFERAAHYYRQAIQEDPSYAVAHAGLAEAYMGMDRWGATTTWAENAERSARRALELDGALPDAHVAMGMVLQHYRRDYAGAESAFEKALSLNPRHANARREHGLLLLRRLGRLDEALAELRQAHDLDPLSRQANSNLAEAYRVRGEYDKAVEAMARRIEIDRNTARGNANMAYTWLALGECEKAGEWAVKALDLQPGFPSALQLQVYVAICESRWDRAAEFGQLLLARHPEDPQSLAAAAVVVLRTGDLAEARRLAEKACRLDPEGWAWPLDMRLATLHGYLLAATGESPEAERWLDLSLQMDTKIVAGGKKNRALPSWLHNSAVVHAIRGDRRRACDWLDRSIGGGWRAWNLNRGHPIWEDLRDDTCIPALTSRIETDLAQMRERLTVSRIAADFVPEASAVGR